MKVILTKGLPASGKSTWAKEWQAEDPQKRIIVCRDDIRMQLANVPCTRMVKWNKEFEKGVRTQQVLLIDTFLTAGLDICIADTHLNESTVTGTINRIKEHARYKAGEVQIEFQDFTDVPLWVCLERDAKRSDSVGETVIISMWTQYLKDKHDILTNRLNYSFLPPSFVFDLDGTLADNNHRSPYDYSKVLQDTPIQCTDILAGMIQFSGCFPMIFASGRPESCREDTEAWIRKHVLSTEEAKKPVRLLMRKTGDKRKDWQVKEEMLLEIIETNRIIAWFDDRWQVTCHLRSLGVPVLNVNFGRF